MGCAGSGEEQDGVQVGAVQAEAPEDYNDPKHAGLDPVVAELAKMLKEHYPTEPDAVKARIDLSRSGEGSREKSMALFRQHVSGLDFTGFCEFMKQRFPSPKPAPEEKLKAMFEALDANSNHFVDAKELRVMILMLQEKVEEAFGLMPKPELDGVVTALANALKADYESAPGELKERIAESLSDGVASRERSKAIFKELSTEKDGERGLDREGFKQFMAKRFPTPAMPDEQAKALFDAMDINNNAFIDAGEMRIATLRLQEKLVTAFGLAPKPELDAVTTEMANALKEEFEGDGPPEMKARIAKSRADGAASREESMKVFHALSTGMSIAGFQAFMAQRLPFPEPIPEAKAKEMFDVIDTNKNEFIEASEVRVFVLKLQDAICTAYKAK